MKRFFTLLAAALIAALPLTAARAATDPAQVKTETKDYRLSGFTGLNVSSVYNVELTRDSRYAVRVEAPDFLMPYLLVEVRDGSLRLGLQELPRDVRRRFENANYDLRATVSMPELRELKMSGASKLVACGEFSTRREFELKLSGATQVRDLSIKAPEADIECSGASKLYLTGSFTKLDAALSGSAAGKLTADAREADLELSGAAKLSVAGTLGQVELEAGGAANYTQEGAITSLAAEANGAARITTSEASAATARVRLSGAAKAIIDVREELSASLSGAASLRYRAGASLKITEQEISRGASMSSFK